MKNVRKGQLKKAIYFTSEEFDGVAFMMFGKTVSVDYTAKGLRVTQNGEEIASEDVVDALSKYLDVKVTSVHASDLNNPFYSKSVWVIYKENA